MKKYRYLGRFCKLFLTGIMAEDRSRISAGINGFFAGATDLLLNAFDRRKVHICNICGWEGARFIANAGSGYFMRHCLCPNCGEINRYRLLISILSSHLSEGTKVLEIGPNRAFGKVLSKRFSAHYFCSDIGDKRASFLSDLTKMSIKDKTFDVIVCMHVLEHIPDDFDAISELSRILKPSGLLFIQVPMSGKPETFEYGFFNPQDNMHVRIYGADIENRLVEAGFIVDQVLPCNVFDEVEIKRLGLEEENTPIFQCMKK